MFALFTIFLLNAMTMAAGARIEYLISQKEIDLAWVMFWNVSILYLVSWVSTIGVSFLWHAKDAPTFVRWLVVFLSVLYGTFPFILYKYLTKQWTWAVVDKRLDMASLVSKAGLDWIIILGFWGWTK
jgi:hypothetical protein